MAWLEKNFILHERDEKGNLIPIDYPVPELNGKIVKIMPLTRGEILSMAEERKKKIKKIMEERVKESKENKIDIDKERKIIEDTMGPWEDFVIRHIIEPKFTKEELKDAKLIKVGDKLKDIVDVLTDAIYVVSGIESAEKAEDELKKK